MTEKFHWTSPDGTEIVLPRLGKVKAAVLRRHRTKDGDDYLFSILEDIASDEAMALIDDLDNDDFNDLTEKWSKSLGESSRSSA